MSSGARVVLHLKPLIHMFLVCVSLVQPVIHLTLHALHLLRCRKNSKRGAQELHCLLHRNPFSGFSWYALLEFRRCYIHFDSAWSQQADELITTREETVYHIKCVGKGGLDSEP